MTEIILRISSDDSSIKLKVNNQYNFENLQVWKLNDSPLGHMLFLTWDSSWSLYVYLS